MTRLFFILALAAPGSGQIIPADSACGARLFESEHCIECHSIHGQGARSAPDLGRAVGRNFTPATLSSTMWNHAPVMWSAMRARNIPAVQVDEQAAADLFAYFYSVRFFEKPGDAGRGKRLFAGRSCGECHGLSTALNPAARPVSQWPALGDPIALTTAMWNHSANMSAELVRQSIKLPALSGQDLTDILVYLRNLPANKNFTTSVQTTLGAAGKDLFEQRGCARCHSGDSPFMAVRLKQKSLTDIAAGMWDHGIRIPAAAVHFEPGEMREVLSYLWAAQFFAAGGDAGHGRKVFSAKHCDSCHGTGAAPPLTRGAHAESEITMVAALWRHGPTMLALMLEKKIPWPRFDAQEMSDLIAYLNTRK